eukprot:TRINITY_DN7108_c0_g2_i1.p1 TRINITY_DN7108_c0_g2~~TRINITY_DN7108_c0_g2_i1.p1  ORF type:complete len:161 (-),score=7.55 TRINITY_DN7108_c0_g2_i1:97-579(-)
MNRKRKKTTTAERDDRFYHDESHPGPIHSQIRIEYVDPECRGYELLPLDNQMYSLVPNPNTFVFWTALPNLATLRKINRQCRTSMTEDRILEARIVQDPGLERIYLMNLKSKKIYLGEITRWIRDDGYLSGYCFIERLQALDFYTKTPADFISATEVTKR